MYAVGREAGGRGKRSGAGPMGGPAGAARARDWPPSRARGIRPPAPADVAQRAGATAPPAPRGEEICRPRARARSSVRGQWRPFGGGGGTKKRFGVGAVRGARSTRTAPVIASSRAGAATCGAKPPCRAQRSPQRQPPQRWAGGGGLIDGRVEEPGGHPLPPGRDTGTMRRRRRAGGKEPARAARCPARGSAQRRGSGNAR